MIRETTVEKSIDSFEDSLKRALHTSYPASVVSYDPDAKTISAQVHYSDHYASDGPESIKEDWSVIEDIPVVFPRGGGWCMTWPLTKGDPVLLVFAERSIDEWFASDGKTDITPQLQATHSESDCFALAGVFPTKNKDGKTSKTDLIISHTDGLEFRLTKSKEVQVTADKVRLGTLDAAKALAKATETNDALTALENKVNLIISVSAASGGLLPPGSLAPPVTPHTSVASTKVFASD